MRTLAVLSLFAGAASAQAVKLPDFKAAMEESRQKQRDECHAQVAKGKSVLYSGPEACFCLDYPNSVRCKNQSFSPLLTGMTAYPDDMKFGSRPRTTRLAPAAKAQPLALPGIAVAAADVPRFLHPRMVGALSLRPAALLDSTMLRGMMTPMLGPQIDKLMAEVRKVERVYLSMSVPVRAGAEPDVVVLVEGDFAQGIPSFLRQQSSMVVAPVNTRLILMGKRASVIAAHARLASKGPAPALPAGLPEGWSSADFWLAGDLSQLPAMPGGMPGKAALGGFDMKDFRTVALAVSMKDDLMIEANLGTATPQAAAKLLTAMREAIEKNTPAGAKAWTEGMELAADGAKVRFSARVKQTEIEAALKPMMQARTAAAAPLVQPKAPVAQPVKSTVWGAN